MSMAASRIKVRQKSAHPCPIRGILVAVVLACAFVGAQTIAGVQDTSTASTGDTAIAASPRQPDPVQPAVARPRDTLQELDRLVVTATRTAHRASEIPASVTIIDRDEIAAAPARNVDDLLQSKVGVLPRRTVGMGEGVPSDINIRGVPSAMAASRVLVLVDGIPTNVSGTSLLLINEIPLVAIERVEIIRGPFSSLYGANAFGGVINIIMREGDGRPKTELSGGGGSFGYGYLEGWSGGGSRASYSVATGSRTIGNYYASDSGLVRNGTVTALRPVSNNGFRDLRFFGKGRFQLTPAITTRLHVRYYGSDLGFGKTKRDTLTPGDSAPGNVDVLGSKFLVGPEATWTPSSAFQVKLWGFYRYVRGEFHGEDIDYYDTASSPAVPRYVESYWTSRPIDGQVQAQATVRAGSHNTVTAGIELLRNKITFGATRDRASNEPLLTSHDTSVAILNGGISVQDELRLWERRLFVVPGLRLDYHSQFGAALSPRLASSLKLFPATTIRLSVGRGFRAPALSELYMPPFRVSPDARLVSNPRLKPEYIWAVDGGVEQGLGNVVVVRVNGFYNLMEELINPMIVSSFIYGDKDVSFRNISRAWSAGAEAEAEARILRALWLTASYTYMETRDESYNVPLDYAPRHKVGAGVRWGVTRGRWAMSGTFSARYVADRQYLEWQAPPVDWHLVIDPRNPESPYSRSLPPLIRLDNYAVADAACKVTFHDRVWAGGDVLNVTDAMYQESGSTRAPGRTMSASVGVRF